MTDLHPIPPRVDDNPASPGASRSERYKLIILSCLLHAIPTILGLSMVIFLAIPALMAPEFRLSPESSLSSLNISTSHVTAQWNIPVSVKNPSKLVAVEYSHMKLLLSFHGRLTLSPPSLISTFIQGPGNVTTVRAEALSALEIVNDLDVCALVSSLKGRQVSIDMVAKSKRRLKLGPWWVPVLDVHISCVGVTFTAPTDGEGGGHWMILGGTQDCQPDVFTIIW